MAENEGQIITSVMTQDWLIPHFLPEEEHICCNLKYRTLMTSISPPRIASYSLNLVESVENE